MNETVFLTQLVKDTLNNMIFGPKERIAIFLGDRVSENEIYVTNASPAFEGDVSSVSLKHLYKFDFIIGAVMNANKILRESNMVEKYMVLIAHSHPAEIGKIVEPGHEAWSVDDVLPKYEGYRGTVTGFNDRGGCLVHFSVKIKSTGKSGDDIALRQVAEEWNIIEYEFFVRPPIHLVGKPMTSEVAVDCYKYDPHMELGKILKVKISNHILNSKDLNKTLLNPTKSVFVIHPKTGNMVLPYRIKM